MTFHGDALRAEGLTDDEIKRIARLEEVCLPPEEIAILKFACKIAREAHRLTDMEFNKIKELGYNDEDIAELIGAVALCVANYVWCDAMDIKVPEIEALVLEEMHRD